MDTYASCYYVYGFADENYQRVPYTIIVGHSRDRMQQRACVDCCLAGRTFPALRCTPGRATPVTARPTEEEIRYTDGLDDSLIGVVQGWGDPPVGAATA